ISVGISNIGREVDRAGDRLQLHLNPGVLTGVLDDRLVFLARRVDRRLVYKLKPLAIFRADAIGSALPVRRVQYPVRLPDVEFPRRVLRAEAFGAVEEITG